MRDLQRRLAKLEATRGPVMHQRIVQHILDCKPAERPDRLAAIRAAEPDAFNIVRIIIAPRDEDSSMSRELERRLSALEHARLPHRIRYVVLDQPLADQAVADFEAGLRLSFDPEELTARFTENEWFERYSPVSVRAVQPFS